MGEQPPFPPFWLLLSKSKADLLPKLLKLNRLSLRTLARTDLMAPTKKGNTKGTTKAPAADAAAPADSLVPDSPPVAVDGKTSDVGAVEPTKTNEASPAADAPAELRPARAAEMHSDTEEPEPTNPTDDAKASIKGSQPDVAAEADEPDDNQLVTPTQETKSKGKSASKRKIKDSGDGANPKRAANRSTRAHPVAEPIA
jgi:hypothetical protein